MYGPRLEPTARIRLANRNHEHYPARHRTILKKTAQWRTSSTHDSVHTGVIGRWFHVHLAHQIHGANASSLLFPEGQPIRLVETPYPRCQWMMIKERKKGARINSMKKSPRGKCTCRDLNLQHWFAWPIEIMRTIHHTIAPSSKKRRLNDRLPARKIRSTRESLEDIST